MLIRNSGTQFGIVSKLLHWSIALPILGLIWLGWYMMDLTYYDQWYNDSLLLHKAVGMVVLALAVLKSIWLVVSPAPDPLPTQKHWEHVVSKFAHWVLFLSMFLIPVTGYIISTSEGDSVSIFGLFEFPALFTISESTRDMAIEIHYYAAYAILGITLLHAGAALKHQFIDKDGTLQRMI